MRYANMKWYSTSPKLNDGNKFFCKLYAEQKDEIEKMRICVPKKKTTTIRNKQKYQKKINIRTKKNGKQQEQRTLPLQYTLYHTEVPKDKKALSC